MQQLEGPFAIPLPRQRDCEPQGCVGVLTSIFSDARRIPFNVARVLI